MYAYTVAHTDSDYSYYLGNITEYSGFYDLFILLCQKSKKRYHDISYEYCDRLGL